MTSKNDMFEFTKSGRILAFIQARSKKQARQRTQLVDHLVRIPKDCKVRAVEKGTLCRAPIFFEKHLRALEDAIEDALAEA
jgi:hypothetical protein